ncbi:MAG TPA: DUF6786 family protein [bacterium]|nr:DUF6786 family protein [bacterium]
MNKIESGIAALSAGLLLASGASAKGLARFGDELKFLQKNTEVVVLSDASGQKQVAVSPALQGRVLTSTAGGPQGSSYGWINHELISSKKTLAHINPFGGEDRFWLGPEGGQYSIFFKPGSKFDLDHWQTPPAVDSEGFTLARKDPHSLVLTKDIRLLNYSGTDFEVGVERKVKLLSDKDVWKKLKIKPLKDIQMVAYESQNTITNKGKEAWDKKTGLLSVWILGMFNPSDHSTVVIPFKPGPEKQKGPIVNDAYFGKVPGDRLVIKDKILFFSGDGKKRSKIGLSPQRVLPVMGSYDADHGILTLVQFTTPQGAADYVNSMWEIQKNPYGGDVANSYNDGPPAPGKKPLGPFYELESSSPAAALRPGKSLTHVHRTIHLEGPEAALDPVAQAVLGVSLADIKTALKK